MCAWCETVFSWLWEEFWSSVWKWAVETMRRCKRRKCKWICACCNKWLCWLSVVIALIVIFILTVIATLVVTVVCAGCFILCIVLCLLGILFGNTKTDECIEAWCQGLPRESDGEPPVDPQTPKDPDGPGPLGNNDGGVLGRSAVPRIDSVASLSRLNAWTLSRLPKHVIVELPQLTPNEASSWQRDINRQLASCGCSEGAALMLVGSVVFAGHVLLNPGAPPALQWSTLGMAIGVAISCGLVGKMLGLVRARVLLARRLHDLAALIAARRIAEL